MKKILFFLYLVPFALYAELDQQKLISHLQDKLDEKSKQITHFPNDLFQIGYFEAISDLYYRIETGKFNIVD